MARLNLRGSINLEPWKKYRVQIRRELRNGTGEIAKVYKSWGFRYRRFTAVRFDKFSSGGGNWPPLAEATIRAKGSEAILKDTRTLMRSLRRRLLKVTPVKLRGLHVRITFRKTEKHPNATVTVGDIAEFHQQGAGNYPARQILAVPNEPLRRQMADDLQKGVDRIADRYDTL